MNNRQLRKEISIVHYPLSIALHGGVAQLGEHLLCKQGVIGSIPFISTSSNEIRTGSCVFEENETHGQLKMDN